jgi:O-antigen ligase
LKQDQSHLAKVLRPPFSGATTVRAGIERTPHGKPASNRISLLLLLGVVLLAPLPYGSVGPAAIVAWCAALAVALLFASLRGLDGRHFLILGGIAIVVGAYALVLHEQLSVAPFFSASKPDPIWQTASEALARPLRASVSMVRDQPLLALGAPMAATLSLVVSFIVCVNRDHANRLVHVVAWSGTAYAVYGIVAFIVDPGHVLWMKKEAYSANLTATFINRNTAAVYFGSCTVLWLLILADRLRRRLPHGGALSFATMAQPLRHLERRTVAQFAAFFTCLTAMFLTGSRAGVVLSLLAAIAALTLFSLKALPLGRKSIRLVLAGTCIVVVLIQVLGAGILERFDSEGLGGGGRVDTYRTTLTMIEDHPWLGTGLGTFAWVFPSYRDSEGTSWGTWDRAHSTPLEIAAEMGLPLAVVIVASWSGAFAILLFGIWRRSRDYLVVIAGFAIGSLACLHSLVDFSLQIPGFAIVALTLLGAGLAQSFRRPALP